MLAMAVGRSRMISARSDDTLPASASSSSGSRSRRAAVALTRLSAGGGSSSLSTLET